MANAGTEDDNDKGGDDCAERNHLGVKSFDDGIGTCEEELRLSWPEDVHCVVEHATNKADYKDHGEPVLGLDEFRPVGVGSTYLRHFLNNLGGMRGYLELPYTSQNPSATRLRTPVIMGAITYALFQGYCLPP